MMRFRQRSKDEEKRFLEDLQKRVIDPGLTRAEWLALDEAYIGLVYKVADWYLPRIHPDYEDLFQVGRIALLDAVKGYKSGFGNRFSTYAVLWIKRETTIFLKNRGVIKLPKDTHALVSRLKQTRTLLSEDLSRLPTDEELALVLGWDRDKIKFYDNLPEVLSLDAPLIASDSSAGLYLASVVPDPGMDPAEIALNKRLIEDGMGVLTKKEKYVVQRTYGLGCDPANFSEIGQEIKCSAGFAGRILRNALKKMRLHLGANDYGF